MVKLLGGYRKAQGYAPPYGGRIGKKRGGRVRNLNLIPLGPTVNGKGFSFKGIFSGIKKLFNKGRDYYRKNPELRKKVKDLVQSGANMAGEKAINFIKEKTSGVGKKANELIIGKDLVKKSKEKKMEKEAKKIAKKIENKSNIPEATTSLGDNQAKKLKGRARLFFNAPPKDQTEPSIQDNSAQGGRIRKHKRYKFYKANKTTKGKGHKRRRVGKGNPIPDGLRA